MIIMAYMVYTLFWLGQIVQHVLFMSTRTHTQAWGYIFGYSSIIDSMMMLEMKIILEQNF